MSTLSPSRSLRIAFDARYIREKPSGIGTYVEALVERLPGLSPTDEFVFWAHRLAGRRLAKAPNAREFVVRPNPNSPRTIFWPRLFASFDGIDVFHTPQNILPQGVPCASVVTMHDVMSIERPDLHMQGAERIFTSGYYQRAVWRALHKATLLIAVTQATADRMIALLPAVAPRVRVIWEAADAVFRPAADRDAAKKKASELTGSDAPYLLLVGANAPTKRHAMALAEFAAKVPRPWRLVLLQRLRSGKGLAALANKLGIADRLVWLSRVTQEDVAVLMQAAGALIQPSIYEGVGLPVLEAMACGCPVVASDIAPFREITAGAARLFPVADSAGLACALREVVDSAELRRGLSAAGLVRSRAFSWDRAARETLEVYHEAAAARA
ncbi:MAG: glycosyltransferase family 1 protein [Chthoniobacterales bacterium]